MTVLVRHGSHTLQESFTLEKYVEKLAQLDPNTGLGPLSKSKAKPFDPKVPLLYLLCSSLCC